MKIFKKVIAAVMAAAIVLSVCAVSAFAVTVPKFNLTVVSQTDSNVVLDLSLEEGSFNALDVAITTSSKIKDCTSIVSTSAFRDLCNSYGDSGNAVIKASNNATMKISIATQKSIDAKIDMYTITLTKSSAGNVSANDIKATVTNCVINDSTGNHDVTDSAKITMIAGTIKFAQDNVTINYKQSTTLQPETSYSAGEITWSSSNTKVATVDKDGKVYGAKTGSAVITASNSDGSVSDTYTVNVKYSTVQWIIVILLFGWIWY
jgi:hypothetical protein